MPLCAAIHWAAVHALASAVSNTELCSSTRSVEVPPSPSETMTFVYGAAQWMAAHSGILMGRNGTGLTVRTTHVYNVRFGISITSFDSTVEGNLVADFSGDGIRVTRDGDKVIDSQRFVQGGSPKDCCPETRVLVEALQYVFSLHGTDHHISQGREGMIRHSQHDAAQPYTVACYPE